MGNQYPSNILLAFLREHTHSLEGSAEIGGERVSWVYLVLLLNSPCSNTSGGPDVKYST